ncbi:MAG TPA: DUF5916 domain-containing protein [Gemmatimonadales bacterium]|nr:DUF5916 domain-containing protein [Gemmatimonadales bacterium]
MILLALLGLLQAPASGPAPQTSSSSAASVPPAGGALPPGAGAVHDGRQGQLRVQVPRIETDIVVDGVLDEPVWGEAARLTGFSHFQPIEGVPAVDSTEVLVWYSPTAIHFGIRAREPHGEVHAVLADRDRIFSDDLIQILLGTYNDSRQAFMFAVNPLGVQGDGVMVERGNLNAGGFNNGAAQAREGSDLSPDYVFSSKGRLVDGGYEVEIRIPFKSLRYQAKDEQTWQIHVLREVQHSGFEDSWVPAQRVNASFLSQAGQLVGLKGLERGLTLDFTPEVTGRLDGARNSKGAWDYNGSGPDIGGTVRWGITNNLTLNGTANPDFSQVESDVTQIQFDPRDALAYPEKRPFFLDGLEQFASPYSLIYTRAIVQPVGAVKLTGKAFGTNVGIISAVDDRIASFDEDHHPVVNVLRVQKDVGTRSRLGLVYTDRVDGDNWNRVGALDGRLVFGRNSFIFQGGLGKTHEFGTTLSGPIWMARFTHSGRVFGVRYQMTGIDPDFRTRSGFISRAGDANLSLTNLFTVKGKPGSLVESFTPDVSLYGTWTYDLLMDGKEVRDPKIHFNLNAQLKGGWQVGMSLLLEKFGYDPRIYRAYALEQPDGLGGLDTVAFTGGNQKIPNRDYVLSISTPEWQRFSANGFILAGQDENFEEWASAEIVFADFGLTFRPTSQLRVEARYRQNQYKRRSDRTLVARQRVPRLKIEYQLARPLFIRLVGEYNTEERDALRDEQRTNAPILIYDRGVGNYVKTVPESSNRFRGDVLLSFTPVPGTVFFAGYGSSLFEPQSFKFRDFQRESDGFFLKASYLFRVGS